MSVLEELEQTVQASQSVSVRPWSGSGAAGGWAPASSMAPGHVLTNAHAVRHDEVSDSFGDGRRESGNVIASDPDLDLAVIEADTAEVLQSNGARRPPRCRRARGAGAGQSRRPRTERHSRICVVHLSQLPRSARSPDYRCDRAHRATASRLLRGAARRSERVGARDQQRPRRSWTDPRDPAETTPCASGSMRSREGERPKSARLGVAVAPPRVARRLRRAVGLPERDGVLIRAVEGGSPAERAGLERGDLIVAAAGKRDRPGRRALRVARCCAIRRHAGARDRAGNRRAHDHRHPLGSGARAWRR